jgi:hypothetical protein
MIGEIFGIVLVNGYVISRVKENVDGKYYLEINGTKTNIYEDKDRVEQLRVDLIERLRTNEKASVK